MDISCIFCQIIAGQAPGKFAPISHYWATLVPLKPISPGHILLIPQAHVENIFELETTQARELGLILREQAQTVKDANKAAGINILNANGSAAQQSVPHLHFHIVPRYEDDNLDLWLREKL